MSEKKQLILNMSASFISYGITLVISFFLSPYIIKTIGVEANGFISLANNFVSYASLITLALNSLAGRFITISLVQGETKKANIYFSSVFYANIVISIVLFVIGAFIVVFLERLIEIPSSLILDVKLLFTVLFLNCIISVVGSVFSVATFARNKLYLESLRNIESNFARALCIVALFAILQPRVSYVGIASLIAGIYVLLCNIYYTKKLLPEIEIKKSYYDKRTIIELISGGIWNTISRLGQIFTNGLDLLVTNLFINSTAMGVLALAQTVPNLIGGVMNSIVGVFSPNYTILYAEGRHDELLKRIKQSMKIMGIMTNLPIIDLIVCGQDFFRLWQPTQDATELQQLSLWIIGCLIFSGGINCLYGIFTVVNKIKANSLVTVCTGFLSVVITLVLVKTTNWGIYAIAGTSTVISILRNLVFTAPYGAKCLNVKWYTFYPEIFRPVLYVVVSSIIGFWVTSFIPEGGWILFFLKCFIVGALAIVVGVSVILNSEERKIVGETIRKRSKNN